MNAIETIGYKGYTIKIYQDEDIDSPRTEMDNVGIMFCEHSRYTLGDKDAENPFIQDEETGKYSLREDVAVALPLYLLDHSGLSISTGDFGDVWDSGQVGVIYATKEAVKREWGTGKAALEKAKAYLKGEVQTYDDYLRGNVYGYVVESPDGRDVDSCWGFYPDHPTPWTFEKSLEYMIGEAKSAIDHDIKQEQDAENSISATFAL